MARTAFYVWTVNFQRQVAHGDPGPYGPGLFSSDPTSSLETSVANLRGVRPHKSVKIHLVRL